MGSLPQQWDNLIVSLSNSSLPNLPFPAAICKCRVRSMLLRNFVSNKLHATTLHLKWTETPSKMAFPFPKLPTKSQVSVLSCRKLKLFLKLINILPQCQNFFLFFFTAQCYFPWLFYIPNSWTITILSSNMRKLHLNQGFSLNYSKITTQKQVSRYRWRGNSREESV